MTIVAEIFAVGRVHGLRVANLCCGALRPIIPDLVEIGLDVLNPEQAGCPGMEPSELKHELGDTLAFMGRVDTQRLLPFVSAAEVRAELGVQLEADAIWGEAKDDRTTRDSQKRRRHRHTQGLRQWVGHLQGVASLQGGRRVSGGAAPQHCGS